MSANITYRSSSNPTIPGSTTVKNSPLTNLEMDANLKALADDISDQITTERTTIATLTGKLMSGSANTFTNIPLTTAVTGTLPVGNGGTGVTTSTGTGATVRASGPTITLDNATGLPLASGVSGTLPVANGGTGVTSSTGTGSNVLSTSPALTGTPTVPTASPGTNTTQAASTAYVDASVASFANPGGTLYLYNNYI